MGIFHEQAEFVNRTSKTLEVVYDGQRIKLQPNYDAEGKVLKGVVNMLPKQCIPFALNQNVLMGSEDAIDPSDFQSLIGIRDPKAKRQHSWNNCGFLEQSEKLTRTPLEDVLEDPHAKIQVRGKAVPRAVDAAMPGSTTPFDPR